MIRVFLYFANRGEVTSAVVGFPVGVAGFKEATPIRSPNSSVAMFPVLVRPGAAIRPTPASPFLTVLSSTLGSDPPSRHIASSAQGHVPDEVVLLLCEGRGKMAAQRNTRSFCLFESEEICVCKVAWTVVNIAVVLAVVRQWRQSSTCGWTCWGGRSVLSWSCCCRSCCR